MAFAADAAAAAAFVLVVADLVVASAVLFSVLSVLKHQHWQH